jgi:transposase
MHNDKTVFVGPDTSKMKIAVALAEQGREGEVRFLGDIDAAPGTVKRLVAKLSSKYGKLSFCYEAGPTGYGLHRQILDLGHECAVYRPRIMRHLGGA